MFKMNEGKWHYFWNIPRRFKKKRHLLIDLKWQISFNPLPNDNILDWFNFKPFADNKINVSENMKIVLGRLENIVGKRENAGYQSILLQGH